MPRVYKRPAARRDLVEHYVYLAENAGEETADRFLRQADVTFALPRGTAGDRRSADAARSAVGWTQKMAVTGIREFPDLLPASPRRRIHRACDVCRAGLVGAAWNHLEAAWGRRANHGILSGCIYTNQIPISARLRKIFHD